MIEDLLKFDRGFGSPMSGEVGLTADIDWIQRAKQARDTAARCAQLMRRGDLERLQRAFRLGTIQRKHGAKCRQISKADCRILREFFLQVVRERLRASRIAGERQRKGSTVLYLAIMGKPESGERPLDCSRSVSEQRFADRRTDFP